MPVPILSERSYDTITDDDLRRLGALAAADRNSLFLRRRATGELYTDRLRAVALCQGAALHWLDGRNGVKDFDVWSFYIEHPDRPYPYRRNGTADFGDPKFGTSPGWEHFVGRRVDLIGRSLPFDSDADIARQLHRYLRQEKTSTARHLAAKAMVLIEPAGRLGEIVWPLSK
jgi:hypothetical protein